MTAKGGGKESRDALNALGTRPFRPLVPVNEQEKREVCPRKGQGKPLLDVVVQKEEESKRERRGRDAEQQSIRRKRKQRRRQ